MNNTYTTLESIFNNVTDLRSIVIEDDGGFRYIFLERSGGGEHVYLYGRCVDTGAFRHRHYTEGEWYRVYE